MQNRILQRLSEDSKLTENCLERIMARDDEKYRSLFESCRYSVFAGGKRIRPFLAIEFCRMLGGKDEASLPFAAAIEMIHTYSLIHDDLPCMDNDTLRRGKPTNHVVYGEAPALLAGDALLTWAFEVAASNTEVEPQRRVEAIKLIADCAGINGMVGGQMIDLIGETERHDMQTLEYMHSKKTGALIKVSCLLGCIAAGGTAEDFEKAEKYAHGIGLSFQIIDDILDTVGDEAKLGKHIGKDKASGKTTFMTYMSIDDAKNTAKKLTDEAISAIEGYKNSEYLRDLAVYLLERDN